MFPLTITITITITNPAQLNAVLTALGFATAAPATTGVIANEKAAVLLATEAAMADTVSPAPVAEAPGKPSAATTAASPPTAEAAPSTSAPSPDLFDIARMRLDVEPTATAAAAPSADDAKPFEYATLQRAVNERVTKLGKDKLLAIAKAHGAATFKELPAAKWQAAYNDVVALGV